jgi:hypothetical protein
MEMLDDPIPRSIKNAYNIVFNSLNGTSTLPNSVSYQFDWERLPRGKYLVNTTMMTSRDENNIILYSPISLNCDLGQTNQTVFFPSNQAGGRLSKLNFVAVLFATGTTINGGSRDALDTYRDQNVGIYLENRPSNNTVLIELRNSFQAFQNYPVTFNYTVVFHFQWLGE